MKSMVSLPTTPAPLSESPLHPRFTGRLRTAAHSAWWLVFATVVLMNLLALPPSFAALQRACVTDICVNQQLNEAQWLSWQLLGLAPAWYAVLAIAISLFPTLIYLAVALVLFRSKPNDAVVFFSSFMLAAFGGVTYSGVASTLGFVNGLWWYPVLAIDYLGSVTIIAFFFIFPNGRFVPRWTRFVLALWAFEQFLELLSNPPVNFKLVPSWVVDGSLLFVVAVAVIAQFYRYRRVSNAVERRQTKWVVFGTITALIGFVGTLLLFSAAAPLRSNVIASVIVGILVAAFFSLIPLSIAIALLRARLWDIDLIINRALVYGTMTAIVAGLLAVMSDLAKRFFLALTGESSELAPIVATLIIVAVFDPIRKRVQELVDRHVKYETGSLGAFGEELDKYVQWNDAGALAERFLKEALASYGAESGAVYLGQGTHLRLVRSAGNWDGHAALALPIEYAGNQMGVIALGAREHDEPYDEADRAGLLKICRVVAHALELAQNLKHDTGDLASS